MNESTQSIRASGEARAADPAAHEAAYRRARRKVRLLRGWQIHALVYVCVIALLWLIYATTGHARFPWPLPATLGWGLGLAIHGLVVWLATSRRGRDWEERKIREYMDEELGKR